jgi:hypothetical protein
MSNMIIRLATLDDIDFIKQLYKESKVSITIVIRQRKTIDTKIPRGVGYV